MNEYWVYRLYDDGRLMCIDNESVFMASLKYVPADFENNIYVLMVETRVPA